MARFNQTGLFLPTTYVWDIAELKDIEANSIEFKELIVKLYQNMNSITTALNMKTTGYYDTNEFVTGNIYFPAPGLSSQTPQTPTFRQSYRQTVIFGALPNAGTTSVPHNIPVNSAFTFVDFYGASFDPTSLESIPLPYASATLIDNIEMNADGTNVNITTSIDYSAFTNTIVVLEYLKF